MTFSLVQGTVGRRLEELERFLRALARSEHRDVELIVVDQSGGREVADLLARYADALPIRRLEAPAGLARARNLGLAAATGDIVAFPDDDAVYPATLLGRVAAWLAAHPEAAGVCGRPVDADGRSSFPRWDRRRGPVDRHNVWRRCNSNALFLRRAAVERVGGFDPALGVGSGTPWGAGEDIDYPLRMLAAGHPLWYEPSLEVVHPRVEVRFDGDADAARRAALYAGGMGRVLAKHRYPVWEALYHIGRPFIGALLASARGRGAEARYRLAVGRARWRGWRADAAAETDEG